MRRLLRPATTIPMVTLLLLVMVPGLLATPAEAASQKNLTKVFFLNMGVQAGAQGKLRMIENDAQTFFKIEVKRLNPGVYDLALDGAVVDTLTVGPDGKGELRYRQRHKGTQPGSPLPYHPAGGHIELLAAGTAVLAAQIPATPEEAFLRTEITIDLDNLGVMPGEAEAELKARFGRMSFEVEIRNATPGTYALMVDGVNRANIVVGATGRGEVEFDSVPSDDEGDGLDLLLTFDPRGKPIAVMQSVTELFSATFPREPVL